MKKKIGFAILALILTAAFVCPTVYAKPYKALTKEVGSPVEIPEEAVFPDYLSRLEYEGTTLYPGMMVNSFEDPEFKYLNDQGNEIQPYMEIIKKEGDSLHLIGIFIVNNENVIEFYMDGEDTGSPVTGKLKKYVPPKEDTVQKVPREKQD